MYRSADGRAPEVQINTGQAKFGIFFANTMLYWWLTVHFLLTSHVPVHLPSTRDVHLEGV